MGSQVDEREPVAPSRVMARQANRAHATFSVILLTSLAVLVGCGQATAGAPVATPSPTFAPTATATAIPTMTATPMASASSTCQPDDYGIYADQAGFLTNLSSAPLPAPPQTKHGIGSTGVNGSVTQGGESGMCTIGAFASVSAFYTQRLPSLGWQYSAPPSALAACFHPSAPAEVWWKGSDTFSWYDQGNAGGGSIFWSYTYCSIQS